VKSQLFFEVLENDFSCKRKCWQNAGGGYKRLPLKLMQVVAVIKSHS
jgi:hypothetical protein